MNKIATLSIVAALAAVALNAAAQDKEPLKTEIPKPMFVGTPIPIKLPNMEPPSDKPVEIMVPKGSVNLAKGKKVTGSDSDPTLGSLDLVTDEDKSAEEGSFVEMAGGKQWVQIDLGAKSDIAAILIWHYHLQARAYIDTVVQVSDDPDFVKDVVTVFNNDHDNSSGLGVGKDYAYVETNKGKWIDAKGVKGRYVRLYSKGSTANGMNHYIEVEVWGKPSA